MLRLLSISVATLALATTAFAAEPTREDIMQAAKDADIGVIPAEVKVDAEKAKLGEELYHDTRLSVDGSVSCATCHKLDKGGVDGLKVSTGVKSQNGPINSPTVFNSEHNFVQFWDGRAKDLQEQAAGPVENPLEMGEKWEDVEAKLLKDESYVERFEKLYGGKPTKENVTLAIAEFERTLNTPGSDFDKYLEGDDKALSASAKRGFMTFTEKGCTACHNGTYLGGNSYQPVSEDYFIDRGGELTDADKGRFNVTKDTTDMHMFKVPMLRNVEVTAPYFHDGTQKNLKQAIRSMGKYQLGTNLTAQEVTDIENFLKSLTGTYKGKKL